MKKRVVLSTKLIIGNGSFDSIPITRQQAEEWLAMGDFENFSGHQTVKILGIEPATSREQCTGYDEALVIKPKSRLEFGREYSLLEIEKIGVEFVLIRRVPSIKDILAIAAKLLPGINDINNIEKLVHEFDALLEARRHNDGIGACIEAGDVAYYAVKSIGYAAHLTGITVDDALSICIAKMSLRAQNGNPSDDEQERAAVKDIIGN